MSAGDETYVANAFKVGQLVEEMWTFDGLTSRQIETLYIRNPLAPGGFDTIFNAAAALPDVTIVSVTEPAVETEDVTVVATTPAGTLTYKFEIDFSGSGGWLTIQDGTSNVWNVGVGLEGFYWRVTVTADDGTNTDSETFNSSGRVEAPSDGALQTMQWVLTTGSSSGTVASTGLEILNPLQTNQLNITGGPRFWFGSESLNYGGVQSGSRYDMGANSNSYMTDNFQARIRQNGRDWIIMDGATPGTIFSAGQGTYNNIGQGIQYWVGGEWWMTQAQGQTFDIEFYAKGDIPDNWYTNQLGAGTCPSSGAFSSITYNTDFPKDPAVKDSTLSFLSSYTAGPSSGYFTPADKAACADYVAWYVSEEEANSGQFGAAKTAGWYVYGPKFDDNPGGNGDVSWPPLAWPTGGSDGNGSGGQWNSAGNYQSCAAWLSDYTGATGNGGTDSWSAPFGSLLDWDTIVVANLSAADTQNGSGPQVVVSLETTPSVMDPYAQDGTSSVEIDTMGWASATQLKLVTSVTVNTTPFAAGLPYAAHWMEQEGIWRKLEADDRGPSKSDMRYSFTSGDYPDYNYNNMGQPDQVVMFFESDPGDVSKWRPYDGPTS